MLVLFYKFIPICLEMVHDNIDFLDKRGCMDAGFCMHLCVLVFFCVFVILFCVFVILCAFVFKGVVKTKGKKQLL